MSDVVRIIETSNAERDMNFFQLKWGLEAAGKIKTAIQTAIQIVLSKN
jgi:hypothetical protein